jgi:uncharacterized protein
VTLSDVNLLLYAVDATAPRHHAARRWLEGRLSSAETLGFAWSVLLAFVRLSTHPSVFVRPLRARQALDLVEDWLGQPPVTVLHPTDRHAAIVRELLEPLGTAGNLVTDAHLAALAIEHGATLASSDRDFARFPRLRWVDPIALG